MSAERLHTLYRQHAPAIYARCLRILGNEAAAADATQETFIRLYRRLDRAPSGDEALLWIYRVATNYCLNVIRDQARRAEPAAQLPDPPGRDLEDQLLEVDVVRRLIRQLPAKVAEVAWLHHVEGLQQDEVARVLDISRRTVVYRLTEFRDRAARFVGVPS